MVEFYNVAYRGLALEDPLQGPSVAQLARGVEERLYAGLLEVAPGAPGQVGPIAGQRTTTQWWWQLWVVYITRSPGPPRPGSHAMEEPVCRLA